MPPPNSSPFSSSQPSSQQATYPPSHLTNHFKGHPFAIHNPSLLCKGTLRKRAGARPCPLTGAGWHNGRVPSLLACQEVAEPNSGEWHCIPVWQVATPHRFGPAASITMHKVRIPHKSGAAAQVTWAPSLAKFWLFPCFPAPPSDAPHLLCALFHQCPPALYLSCSPRAPLPLTGLAPHSGITRPAPRLHPG